MGTFVGHYPQGLYLNENQSFCIHISDQKFMESTPTPSISVVGKEVEQSRPLHNYYSFWRRDKDDSGILCQEQIVHMYVQLNDMTSSMN